MKYEKLIATPNDLRKAIIQIHSLMTEVPEDRYVITFQREKVKRRLEQNKLYWKMLHAISDQLLVNHTNLGADTWAEFFKRRFIGIKEFTLPDGECVTLAMSSTELSVAEFTNYITMIQAWMVDNDVIFNEENI